jgi:hypothetical protein
MAVNKMRYLVHNMLFRCKLSWSIHTVEHSPWGQQPRMTSCIMIDKQTSFLHLLS